MNRLVPETIVSDLACSLRFYCGGWVFGSSTNGLSITLRFCHSTAIN